MMYDTQRQHEEDWEPPWADELRKAADEARAYLAEREKQERIEAERKAEEDRRAAEILKRRDALRYSDQAAQEICERIACGELMLNICDDPHLPTMRQAYRWMAEHDEFKALFRSAIEDRLNIFEEQVVQIADDMSRDYKRVLKNGVEKRVPDPEQIARARLRIEVRFRHLKAGRPQKWGDAQTLTVKSDDGLNVTELSMEQLEAKIAAIEKKSSIVRAG
jgi:hypothetical protein